MLFRCLRYYTYFHVLPTFQHCFNLYLIARNKHRYKNSLGSESIFMPVLRTYDRQLYSLKKGKYNDVCQTVIIFTHKANTSIKFCIENDLFIPWNQIKPSKQHNPCNFITSPKI